MIKMSGKKRATPSLHYAKRKKPFQEQAMTTNKKTLCAGCGKDITSLNVSPDPALSGKIVCGHCASQMYQKVEFNPALDFTQKELEQIRNERREIYDSE